MALREWRYDGDCQDYEEMIETCQMCEHPDLRYHFKIENDLTGFDLWVGSECITRFDIAAVDQHGDVVQGEAAARIVAADRARLQEAARRKRLLATLRELWMVDAAYRETIQEMAGYVETRGAFTPKQMSLLAWRLKANKVKHAPRDFTVIMRRDREKDQVRQMDDWRFGQLAPYLSASQLVRSLDMRS